MKQFNEDFKIKLYQNISDIENNSLVEIVAIVRQQSDHYKDIGLMIASILTGIAYTIMILLPFDINPYLIYVITIALFFFAFFVTMSIPSILRIFIPKKRINKSVEIMARAIFQKGGIRFTEERIGVLFFVSYLEKKVFIIADRGAQMAVPQEEWDEIQSQFNACFNDLLVAENILKTLSNTKDIFNKYIPPVENDINELPDNLEVNI
ncbi:MAG: hypothetical protein JXL97_15195 [Bacteroidales bacterium]|nr:hypothetical protein [Bacteroidales bacterium]